MMNEALSPSSGRSPTVPAALTASRGGVGAPIATGWSKDPVGLIASYAPVVEGWIIPEVTVAEPKTKKTNASVDDFLHTVADQRKREDCFVLVDLMRAATGSEPAMWGDSIVGFGGYQQTYSNGKEYEWPVTAFSPRKQSLTLYIMSGFEQDDELLGRLGKHTTSKACLYIKRLSDVDITALRELIEISVAYMAQHHPSAKEDPSHG